MKIDARAELIRHASEQPWLIPGTAVSCRIGAGRAICTVVDGPDKDGDVWLTDGDGDWYAPVSELKRA